VFRLLFIAWVVLLIFSPPRSRYHETAVRDILFPEKRTDSGCDEHK